MTSTERPRGFGSDSPTGSGRARGSPQRARRRLVLEIYCEESRDVALVVVHVLELFKFNICIV